MMLLACWLHMAIALLVRAYDGHDLRGINCHDDSVPGQARALCTTPLRRYYCTDFDGEIECYAERAL